MPLPVAFAVVVISASVVSAAVLTSALLPARCGADALLLLLLLGQLLLLLGQLLLLLGQLLLLLGQLLLLLLLLRRLLPLHPLPLHQLPLCLLPLRPLPVRLLPLRLLPMHLLPLRQRTCGEILSLFNRPKRENLQGPTSLHPAAKSAQNLYLRPELGLQEPNKHILDMFVGFLQVQLGFGRRHILCRFSCRVQRHLLDLQGPISLRGNGRRELL